MKASSIQNSSPLMLYGFARSADWSSEAIADLEKQPGLFGSPMSVHATMGVIACTELISSLDLPRSSEYALAYGTVIEERLSRNKPFIPCRFVTVLPSKEVLLSVLQQRTWALSTLLDQLVARQEYSLRIYWKSPHHETQAIHAHQGKSCTSPVSDLAVSKIASSIANCSFWSKDDSGTNGSLLYRGSFLIDDARLNECLGNLTTFQESYPNLSLLFLGPFPPYTYVAHAMGNLNTML